MSNKASIEELEKLLARDSEVMLQILPNGEIREYSEEEQASIRSERKPLTMRENLGGEYASSSFSVPAELASEYKHEAHEPPTEAVMLAREEEENAASMDFWIHGRNPPPVQNTIDPSVPPPPSASLEEIIEATKHVPRRLFSVGYGPHYVAAIAASLAAEFPGMFAGDVLRPLGMPLPILPSIDVNRVMRERRDREMIEQVVHEAQGPIVDSVPQIEKRPGHRKGYRVGLMPKSGGKPAGSKLARKAARGRL